MNFEEDNRRKEISIYDKQCKVWYEFLKEQANKINNYLNDTKSGLDSYKLNLEERLKELDEQYNSHYEILDSLQEQISTIEYYQEVQEQEIEAYVNAINSAQDEKDKHSRDVLQKEKEELITLICEMKHSKIEDWLKTIKKDLPDGDLKDILKTCYRLFYGAKTFSLEEFIENVLSKGESKTEIEAPANWIKEKGLQQQGNDKLKFKLSSFLAKFAIYNRQELNKDSRQMLKQLLDSQVQRQKQTVEVKFLVSLLEKFNNWDNASSENDKLEQNIKELEQTLEEKQNSPEYVQQQNHLHFLQKEQEFTNEMIEKITNVRSSLEDLLQSFTKYEEYQQQQVYDMQSTVEFNSRNEEIEALQTKEQIEQQ
ncbi:unnamed protein product [Paramecium primaurelia]|uniref:Uncharacterized protein n=2 Tax=Paramecium TaxID=5884 RepID=A0A8S1UHA3_9CILI|nr:unnamed protein product [Paramecium primaurelia]CAD8163734.1 unnamed protein product [Paramecium pentaurelia]